MIEGLGEDLNVKRTAVKLLSWACNGLVGDDAPLPIALRAALRSPTNDVFIYNYRIAEQEFLRLPRGTSDRLLSLCRTRLLERHRDITAEARASEPRFASTAPPLARATPASAVEWS